MNMDILSVVEEAAEDLARLMGADWESLGDPQRRIFRKTAAEVVSAQDKGNLSVVEEMIGCLNDLLTDPSTPKYFSPGLKAALAEIEIFRDQVLVFMMPEIPDTIETIADPDPYLEVEPGDADPYLGDVSDEVCGKGRDGGWSCTRPPHPVHWKHIDADPNPNLPDGVKATWFEGEKAMHVHEYFCD